MTPIALIPFVAAALAVALAVASVVRTTPSIPSAMFAAGMLLFGLDSLCTGLALRAETAADLVGWLGVGLLAKACLPATWLAFSSCYARREQVAQLRSNTLPIFLAVAVPASVLLVAPASLLAILPPEESAGAVLITSGRAARVFHAALLVGFVLTLMNLEQTLRASVGKVRWRLKYVAVGLGVPLGAAVFVRSQAILYTAYDPLLGEIESSALLVGGVFLIVAYWRDGFGDFDVHPSRAVLRSSFTVLIVGGYLLLVGLLAQLARRLGGAESFQLQALVVLAGTAGLAILLLSDRLRQRLQAFVGRHFTKAQYDSVRLWTDFSRRLSTVRDARDVCAAIAAMIADSFEVLGVSIWCGGASSGRLQQIVSTAPSRTAHGDLAHLPWPMALAAFGAQWQPVDLEAIDADAAELLRVAVPRSFANGGRRLVVPIRSGDDLRGLIVLSDRVNGAPWTAEEQELLQCLADQMAAALENHRLADEVALGRELEAFRAMSAFFVHDLKNATNSLNLMLKNLPVHFEDPAFRADALRAIGNTVTRIDGMIARLGALRRQPGLHLVPVAPVALVEDAATELQGSDVALHCAVPAGMPMIKGDRDQLRSVVANLLLNARDAIATRHQQGASEGRIGIRASVVGQRVVLEVEDNGCGMSPAFLRDGLFRPFQSTKAKGLGIGMFQARQVIEQHGGSIQVESEQDVGTTVRISLPLATEDHAA